MGQAFRSTGQNTPESRKRERSGRGQEEGGTAPGRSPGAEARAVRRSASSSLWLCAPALPVTARTRFTPPRTLSGILLNSARRRTTEWKLQRLTLLLFVSFGPPDGHFRGLLGGRETRGRSLGSRARRDGARARRRSWLLVAAELRFGSRLNSEVAGRLHRPFARRFLINGLWNRAGRGAAHAGCQNEPKPYAKEEPH